MDAVVAHVKRTTAPAQLLAVGFSAGANLLTKYIGSRGAHCDIAAAVSVSNAFDLVQATQAFTRSSPVLDIVMTHGASPAQHVQRACCEGSACCTCAQTDTSTLTFTTTRAACKSMYLDHVSRLSTAAREDLKAACPVATRRVLRCRSVRAFDAAACPVPHAMVDDLYATEQCVHVLRHVTIPMLLLNARDDPVIDASLASVALAAARANPHLVSVVTQRGGHMGWQERPDGGACSVQGLS